MAEPEQHGVHNYAYHPSVENWVHSTSLAHFDRPTEDAPSDDPDAFYRRPHHQPGDPESSFYADDMTTTRQRQQTSKGVSRSTPKPSTRSVSGPATSTTRATPQLPGNRPTVKDLAQKFNQSPSSDSSPQTSRVRSARPSPSARAAALSQPSEPPASSTSSPARSAREASYGAYKFSNLKPRERPQPAPASPVGARRTNGRRPSAGDQPTSPNRRLYENAVKAPRTTRLSAREQLFGAVVGEHDGVTPGYGIPTSEPVPDETSQTLPPTAEEPPVRPVPDDLAVLPQSQYEGNATAHQLKSPSNMIETSAGGSLPSAQPSESANVRTPRRHSPPSRIPVATRRMSAASDSGSSTRSLKAGSARPAGNYTRASPIRRRPLARDTNLSKELNGSALPTLPAVSYRQVHARGKSPKGVSNAASLTAVINAAPPPHPTSPRLRHSRERRLLTPNSPRSRSQNGDQRDNDIDDSTNASRALQNPGTDLIDDSTAAALDTMPIEEQKTTNEPKAGAIGSKPLDFQDFRESLDKIGVTSTMNQSSKLTLHTTSLPVPQPQEALSTATSFEYEESPVLGMPGSFLTTPPLAQHAGGATNKPAETRTNEPQVLPDAEPEGELLQPRTFQPVQKSRTIEQPPADVGPEAPSELGIRESIPIMLGADESQPVWSPSQARSRQSPRINIGAQKWRARPRDAPGSTSYFEENDSPVDPFANRESLRPDDSASVAFFHPRIPPLPENGALTLDSEAYSVINKVLNLYHESSEISPEVAHESQRQVLSVSPVIAQHRDWGSKEATETYLARLLSDANVSKDQDVTPGVPAATALGTTTDSQTPSLTVPGLDDEPESPGLGGTAIIFPPVSRRYSRGSRGSSNTNSWGDGSRADSSSALSRDITIGAFAASLRSRYAPQPPPKDRHYPKPENSSLEFGESPRTSDERVRAPLGAVLPEIQSAGEGLGLSLHTSRSPQLRPPRPPYSPPPPPVAPLGTSYAAPYTPSVYAHQPPSSIVPQAPLPYRSYEMADSAVWTQGDPAGGSGGAPDEGPDDAQLLPNGDSGRGQRRNPRSPAKPTVASSVRSRSDEAADGIDAEPASAVISQRAAEVSARLKTLSDNGEFAGMPGARSSATEHTFNTQRAADSASAQSEGTVHVGLSDSPEDLNGDITPTESADGDKHLGPSTTTASSATAVDNRDEDPGFIQLKKAYNVIRELIKTERHYGDDMTVIGKLFYDSAVVAGILTEEERRIMFANSPELQVFAMRLWDAMRKSIRPILQQKPRPPQATANLAAGNTDSLYETAPPLANQPYPWDEFEFLNAENFAKITLGRCLLRHMKQLERLYTTYVLNQHDANQLLKDKGNDWKLLGWQKACMDGAKGLTSAWDLDSLLVKPVQRMTKYPLMLDQLIQLIPKDHPDLPDLEAARKEILAINFRINESKERQEKLTKVTSTLDAKKDKGKGFLDNRFGKNFVKTLGLKSDRPKPPIEDTSVFNDEEYTYQAQRFGGHFFQIQVVIRDIEKYTENILKFMLRLNIIVQNFMAMLDETLPAAPTEIASDWTRKSRSLLDLHRIILEDHRQAVKARIVKPIVELFNLYIRPQKLMDQRKKALPQYVKYKQALDRKEKIDPKLQDAADTFLFLNKTLREELPLLYAKTKTLILVALKALVMYQKDWWKNAQKVLLPLLESEPEYTTSFAFDLKAYQERFLSDYQAVQTPVLRLGIVNHSLLDECANFMSPAMSMSAGTSTTADDNSSRKSSSRRTESISSDISNHADVRDARARRSGGYDTTRANLPSSSQGGFTTSWRNFPHSRDTGSSRDHPSPVELPASTPGSRPSQDITHPGYGGSFQFYHAPQQSSSTPAISTANRAMSPESDSDGSEATVTQESFKPPKVYSSLDGAFDDDYMAPAMQDSAFLGPSRTYPFSNSSSSRTSGVFNSALPMSDSPITASPITSNEEPEVLFLAASLFEFNIAHDRREGGIPYLVYVPGEIFDVIGMKGELWLARNQDDPTKTVGWIWEKHFARILPDES